MFLLCECLKLLVEHLAKKYKKRPQKLVLLMGDPSPLCLPTDTMHRIKWTRRSHSIFHTASDQKWTVRRPVNEATLFPSYYLKLQLSFVPRPFVGETAWV